MPDAPKHDAAPDGHIRDLCLLAKSFALERRADSIEEADLFAALRSYRVSGTPAAVREALGGRSAGNAPLSEGEREKRLALAKESGRKLKMSNGAKRLRDRIANPALRLEPAASFAGLPPALRRIARYEAALKAEVRGQDAAMSAIARRLAGARQPGRPAGVYVLAGAPGSGKSLTALALAAALDCDHFAFNCSRVASGKEDGPIRGDQSVFSGSGPGELTSFAREHPDCVVELRNFEMMSPEAHGFLLDILDTGRLKDNYGFYAPGETAESRRPIAPPEVDFGGVHLVLELHGCDELYDSPELLRRLREEDGEGGIRRALADSLRKMTTTVRQQERPTFSGALLAKLENMACFCLFVPLDSAALLDIVRAALPEALREAGARLGLAVADAPAAELDAAAKMLLWEKGGRAAAGAFAPSALAEVFFEPPYAFLRDRGGSPGELRLTVGAEARQALEKIGAELGGEPVRALFRGLRRLRWEPKVSLEGEALVFALEGPELVRAPAAEDFGEGPDKLVVEAPTTRFADVAGLRRVKAKLRERVARISDWKALKAKGHDARGGILLHGPPGTGKTLLATACAGEFGLPYLATTGTRLCDIAFQRRIFTLMRKYAPAILFVDEIDGVCASTPAVLELQGHMDGFASGDVAPVCVIAATNHPDRLPDALTRAGRLGEHIEVPNPDREAREAMFSSVKERLEDGVLDRLLDFTAGLSGATVREAARDMALLDSGNGGRLDEELARNLLLEKLYGERLEPPDEETRKKVAYHEAGHAALLLDEVVRDMELRYITLTFREGDAAHVSSERKARVFAVWDKERYLHQMAVSLAGMTAQTMLAEKTGNAVRGGGKRMVDSGDGSDLGKANLLAYRAVTSGLDEEIGLLWTPKGEQGVERPFGESRDRINERMRVWLNEAETLARTKLDEKWPLVEALARPLMEKGALSRREIDGIVRELEARRAAPDGATTDTTTDTGA